MLLFLIVSLLGFSSAPVWRSISVLFLYSSKSKETLFPAPVHMIYVYLVHSDSESSNEKVVDKQLVMRR